MSSVRVYPEDLPAMLVDPLSFTPEPNAKERPRDQGEMRMRPRFRSVPDLCTASWIFQTQEDFDAFDEWYEDTLQAGSLDFDIQAQDRGTQYGHRWYTAQIVGDYRADVIVGPRYRVTATLRLIDDLGTVRIPPGIEATIGLNFTLAAQTVPPSFAATIGLNFTLTAEMLPSPPGVTIELLFGMAWVSAPSPAVSQGRETDAGDARETDAGTTRDTE